MNDKKYDRYLFGIVILISAIIFTLIYGIKVINPLYDSWLYSITDLSQHYVGWKFYRTSAWKFPFGLIDTLAYPSSTSIIFTDSIPIFAVIFKVLSPILPDTFQYFGLWGIMSFMLQGYFAAKILRKYSVGRVQTLLGSVLFVIAPTVIEKMFRHTALGGQWIILVTIYIFACHKDDYRKFKKISIEWFAIGFLIAAIHLYFLPMCGIFLGGYIICSIIRDKKLSIWHLIPGAAFLIGVVGNTWLLGGLSTGASGESDGLGECSFNLNGFFNSKGYSRVFESLSMCFDSQYEGFAYLGLGIFVLAVLAFVYFMINLINDKDSLGKSKDFWLYGVVYLLMSIGLIMFAASPIVTWNDKILFRYPYSSTLYHYWGYFRSSGRVVWPVCYLIFIGVLVCNNSFWRGKSKYVAGIIVLFCVCLQSFDISGKLLDKKSFYNEARYDSFMESDVWDKLARIDSVKHVIWASNSFENKDIVYLADYAYKNGWTMNIYYFARGINVRENTEYSLSNLSNENVYLFNLDDELDYGLNYYEVDGVIIGTVFEIE
jgi:hypothetical protein